MSAPAILSGVLMGLAFLPAPLGFLAWFALVPLLVALDRQVRSGAGARAHFALGFQFGLAFFLIGVHWILLLSDVAMTMPWVKYPAWALAAAYLAVFPGLVTLLAGWLARRSGASLAAVFPFAYLAVEELRASGELGFPWFQPGYTQHAYAPIVQLASLGSVTTVTLWLLALNVLAWRAVAGRARLRAALGAALLLAVAWGWGIRTLEAAPREHGPRVALVQGNIPGEIKWSGRHQHEILATFLALTDSALALPGERPMLVIWPETATGSYLRKQLEQSLQVAALAARTGVPVFSGYADYALDARGEAEHFNAAGMFRPDGSLGDRYGKRHLVPFGERMPFQNVLPALGRMDFGQAEWTPGRERVLFDSAAGPFGVLICFESIFPDLPRGDVNAGARWLVNITNDEWFGNGAALQQHAAMALFRAAETRVPLARCGNTGLTLVADAYGRVTAKLPVFRPGVLVTSLPVPGPRSWFLRLGDWPGVLAGVLVAAWSVRAWMRRRERSDAR